MTLEEVKKSALIKALKKSKGNKSEAARELGVCVRTMRNMCHQYNLKEFIYDACKSKNMRQDLPTTSEGETK